MEHFRQLTQRVAKQEAVHSGAAYDTLCESETLCGAHLYQLASYELSFSCRLLILIHS
jgi:hypothetical protein